VAGPILVTGAGGFVGHHLLAELGADGAPLDVDVTDGSSLTDAISAASPRAVVHLAALSSVSDSWSVTGEVWRVNVLGTVNVLEAVGASAPEARVLVASTGEVYGRAEMTPTPEEALVAPISPYASSKAAAELACAQAQRDGFDVVVTRAFQHEGPGRDERFAVGSWAAQLARLEEAGGGKLAVGDLSASRDILDVRDVSRAYRGLLDPSIPGGTYNIASGKAVSMQEVLDILLGMARCPVEVERDPERIRPAEIPLIVGDPSKLAAATGWAPTIPLEQILADTLQAARTAAAERMASA
jgi:GDP-4-dehydro-6-deoxy-D-mannose reductase